MAEYQQLCQAAPATRPKVQPAACSSWRQRRPKWVPTPASCQSRSARLCGAFSCCSLCLPYLLLGVGDVEGGHRLHAQLRRVGGRKLLGVVRAVEVLQTRRDMGRGETWEGTVVRHGTQKCSCCVCCRVWEALSLAPAAHISQTTGSLHAQGRRALMLCPSPAPAHPGASLAAHPIQAPARRRTSPVRHDLEPAMSRPMMKWVQP